MSPSASSSAIDLDIERRIAQQLATLRAEHGWSLDALAERTGISRATLSRLERSELSPTAAMLGTLCTVYGWTLSRLMAEAETQPPNLVPSAQQATWTDPESRYRRRIVSPAKPAVSSHRPHAIDRAGSPSATRCSASASRNALAAA